MTAREFYDLVVQMRTHQKAYFKTRSQLELKASMVAEKLVDDEIVRVQTILARK